MSTLAYFVLAAVTEIAGCFAFWAWLRLNAAICCAGALVILYGPRTA